MDEPSRRRSDWRVAGAIMLVLSLTMNRAQDLPLLALCVSVFLALLGLVCIRLASI